MMMAMAATSSMLEHTQNGSAGSVGPRMNTTRKSSESGSSAAE